MQMASCKLCATRQQLEFTKKVGRAAIWKFRPVSRFGDFCGTPSVKYHNYYFIADRSKVSNNFSMNFLTSVTVYLTSCTHLITRSKSVYGTNRLCTESFRKNIHCRHLTTEYTLYISLRWWANVALVKRLIQKIVVVRYLQYSVCINIIHVTTLLASKFGLLITICTI